MPLDRSVLVTGGYGHIGTFLVPRLVRAGWQVTVLTRGRKKPPDSADWQDLPHRHLNADYSELCKHDQWKDLLAELRPAAVIDTLARDAPAVVRACPASVEHVIVCGSVWMYGPPRQVPTPERTQGECPFEPYRQRYQQLLSLLSRTDGPAITGIMPSNIAGPGKIPLEPYGSRSLEVHRQMSTGCQIALPADGQTLVGPTDAQDIAEVFALALEKPQQAAGRMFNAAAAYAITFNEMVATYSRIYSVEISVRHVTWQEFDNIVRPEPSQRYHHEAHMCADITAARAALGYEPAFTPEQALERAVEWMHSTGLLAD